MNFSIGQWKSLSTCLAHRIITRELIEFTRKKAFAPSRQLPHHQCFQPCLTCWTVTGIGFWLKVSWVIVWVGKILSTKILEFGIFLSPIFIIFEWLPSQASSPSRIPRLPESPMHKEKLDRQGLVTIFLGLAYFAYLLTNLYNRRIAAELAIQKYLQDCMFNFESKDFLFEVFSFKFVYEMFLGESLACENYQPLPFMIK